MNPILGLLSVFVLVGLNGFFVAAEFSLVAARRTRITQLAAEGSAAAKAAERALHNLDRYIAATQLGITLASLALGWVGEPAVGSLLEPVLKLIPLEHDTAEAVSHTLAIVVAFSFVTFLHIVMGELVPKSIALQRPEATALLIARPITWFLLIFRPVISAMNGIGNWIVKMLGFEPAAGEHRVHSAEEIEMLVQSSREAGVLQASEETLLRRVFDFSDIRVEEIMQPRVEVEAIATDMPLAEMLAMITGGHHSRYPIYADSMDNVVGLLLTKDLLDWVVRQPDILSQRDKPLDLKPILRKPLFIPATVGLDKLLEQMQQTKTHLAVVIDEYGGMAGVATMEDVIEQLVGEVMDEFDEAEDESMISEGEETLVDGLVSLTEVVERFGEPEHDPESTTIGGYIAEQLNRIPLTGDKVQFGDYDVEVEEMEGMRVAKVRFTRQPLPMSDQSSDQDKSEATSVET